ncbi:TPA: dTDP-4-dehydrorhamnose reductase [Campylobacter lari]|uniref:dTDP-4-dehydrorhamnose reductase n=1 Tax=Campylobacter sp. FU_497 TaxID=2911610 RepID=UPI0021E66B36|nr:dTDP-4-dehydrorhamnose reductase [Campylobacter sp. FU_497]MCV3462700.1 dTDP-4-dehydrorhamnose reductase [Campylobacter sp. FU_497]HEC1758834.1 dTDP-4-dehydrorhamnose reductase [Campylobacter lari]
MLENVLVIGKNGQLAIEIKHCYQNKYNFIFKGKEEIDLQDEENLHKIINENNIKIIINCAAYTAVDLAESEIEKADILNYKCVEILAKLAKQYELKFVHISTDYVFDGKTNTPYNENDETNPLGIYGKTKLKGEQAIMEVTPKNTIIIRTSWLYSSYGKNFVKTMQNLGRQRKELRVVFDQIGSPTYARDLAETILNILPVIQNEKPEIYHYSNEGVASWYDFTKEIMKISQIDCNVKPIESKDFPTLASRPSYSVLNKQKIKEKFHIEIPYWKDSLEKCISILQKGDIL